MPATTPRHTLGSVCVFISISCLLRLLGLLVPGVRVIKFRRTAQGEVYLSSGACASTEEAIKATIERIGEVIETCIQMR